MKKVNKLTESDLVRLVKKIIKEDRPTKSDTNLLIIEEKDTIAVKQILDNLPKYIRFMVIMNCEFADFDGVDLCSHEFLQNIRIVNTDTNIEDQGYECLEETVGNMYPFKERKYTWEYV